MIYKLFSDSVNEKIALLGIVVLSFFGVIALLKLFKNKLPADQGREFAFNGKLSAGKKRGAGIIFVSAFVIASLLFVRLTPENIVYYILIFASMLSGYLDDKAKIPWGEYKKGLIDLAITALTALTFANFNDGLLKLDLYFIEFDLPKFVFVPVAAVFLWLMINATNCSDGIDGLCGTLSINSMVAIAVVGLISGMDNEHIKLIASMIFAIIAYLWFNAEPSSMLMGDAGSRAIGLFIGLSVMKTGNMLLAIPLCFIILLDGLIGIVKISLIRFLKINALKKIRTPLHDHFRKNKTWSNTQVIFRFQIIQILISLATVILMK